MKRRCVGGLPFLGLQIGLHGFGNPRFWSSFSGDRFCSGEVRSASYWAVRWWFCSGEVRIQGLGCGVFASFPLGTRDRAGP